MHCLVVLTVILGLANSIPERRLRQPHFRHLSPSRGVCPSGFFPFSYDACAMNSNKDFTWYDALAFCESQGARMLEVHSMSDQKEMETYLINHNIHDIWLAGSDFDEEGLWKWQSGFPFQYLNGWDPAEPSNGKDEDCIEIQNEKNYKWNDEPCYRWGRNEAFCKVCSRTAMCPANQGKGQDHCCVCKMEGMIKLSDTEICVRQSSYSKEGEPEYIYDGRSETIASTGVQEKPSIEINFPEGIPMTSLAIELTRESCSRVHDLMVYCGKSSTSSCGMYNGNKLGQDCRGKIRVIDLNTAGPIDYLKLEINGRTKKCSQAKQGEVCVEDSDYLGDNVNQLQIAEITIA